MAILEPADHAFANTVGALAHCNPFVAERIQLEQRALGSDFEPCLANWNIHPEVERDHQNLARLLERSERLLHDAHAKLASGANATARELGRYEDLFLLVLYHRFRADFDKLIAAPPAQAGRATATYAAFRRDAQPLLCFTDRRLPLADNLAHVFAGFFQIRRAFANIFQFIIGTSEPAVRLRAAVWESIFTHDMRRYRTLLFDRMADFTTLITGASGTGKELVARAIGLSRYIPLDEKSGKFRADFAGSFYAVNLAALSPTLIESELFGHKRGSFTGAVADRRGWLEACSELGTVFLDEIGEVDVSIQVKLLRVLQSRQFSRLGETDIQHFGGKIIAATNRDLAEEMSRGNFRQDFYYRLCSDVIRVPSLHERIADHPDELRQLVNHLTQRVVGPNGASLAEEVTDWIDQHLGRDYAWPGNIRELEQCVRNVLIHRSYVPPQIQVQPLAADLHDELFSAIAGGELTADELLRRYCALVYAATGSYEATAKKLKLDRRTVRAKVSEAVRIQPTVQ